MTRPTLRMTPEMGWYQIGEDWTLQATVFDAELGQEALPTAATITLLNAGGGALNTPVSGASMTIAGGTVSYTLAAGNIVAPQRALQAKITLTVDGDTFTVLHLFDAVWFSPRMVLTPNDVAAQCPSYRALAPPSDPENMGAIRDAWTDVLLFVQALGNYPDLLLNPADLRLGHLYRSLEMVYGRSLMEDNGMCELQRRRWHDEWVEWQKRARPAVDRNDSGTIEPEERSTSSVVVGWGRRPA